MVRPEQSKPLIGLAPPQRYATPRYCAAIATARPPIPFAGGSTPPRSGSVTTGSPAIVGAAPNPSDAHGPAAVTTLLASCELLSFPRSRRPTSSCAPCATPGYPAATLRRSPT